MQWWSGGLTFCSSAESAKLGSTVYCKIAELGSLNSTLLFNGKLRPRTIMFPSSSDSYLLTQRVTERLKKIWIYFILKWKWKSLSHVWLFVTLWTVACQALLSMGFSRQKYWSGLPFPSPRNLPDPGIEPASPALAGRFFTPEPLGKPLLCSIHLKKKICYFPWARLLSPWLGKWAVSLL